MQHAENAHIKQLSRFWLPSWLLVSTIAIALLMWLFPHTTWLLYLKDASIVLFLVLNAVAWVGAIKKMPLWTLGLVLLLTAQFFLSDAPILARLAALRQLVIPFVLLSIGMLLGQNKMEENNMTKWILGATIFLVIAGFCFYILPVWKLFSLAPYLNAKNLAVAPDGLPYMFYDPLLGNFPRMVSTLLDPINLGHLLVFAIAVGFFENKMHRLWVAIFTIALLMTFCKGAFLQLFLILLIMYGKQIPRWGFILILGCLAAGLVVAARLHPGVSVHLEGLWASIRSATFFGHGLGAVGNQAAMYGKPLELGIADTFLGSILGQIGLIGLLFWLLPFVWVIINTPGRLLLHAILISQLVVSALSENAFNLLSVLFVMLAAGAAINNPLNNEKVHSDS